MFIKQNEGHGITGVTIDLTVREAQVLKSRVLEVHKEITKVKKEALSHTSTKDESGGVPGWLKRTRSTDLAPLLTLLDEMEVLVDKMTIGIPSMEDVYDELFKRTPPTK